MLIHAIPFDFIRCDFSSGKIHFGYRLSGFEDYNVYLLPLYDINETRHIKSRVTTTFIYNSLSYYLLWMWEVNRYMYMLALIFNTYMLMFPAFFKKIEPRIYFHFTESCFCSICGVWSIYVLCYLKIMFKGFPILLDASNMILV